MSEAWNQTDTEADLPATIALLVLVHSLTTTNDSSGLENMTSFVLPTMQCPNWP